MEHLHQRTWVEVDLGIIKHNYHSAMANLGADAQGIAVVKSNAYGHGDVAVSRCLHAAGVSIFAVANIDEARILRRAGISGDILILGYTPPEAARELLLLDLTQSILSLDYARALADACGKDLRCEIAIDTGMHRIGFDAGDEEGCKRSIELCADMLNVTGIFTHLCAADGDSDDDRAFTARQIKQFEKIVSLTKHLGIARAHALNSAGLLYHADVAGPDISGFARPGIILYGLSPRVGEDAPCGILPALSWRATVAMVKTIRKGESIGYGRAFVAERDMVIATIPIGYADGYPRALSGKGRVLIRGQSAPVLGRICMNQMMVDISDIEGVAPGDVATLIGKDGAAHVSADEIALLSGTISYEIVSRIAEAIPRVYKSKN